VETATNQELVGWFVTCLVDLMRPSVAFSAISLLEQAGCEVVVSTEQTCCGQPGYNSGDRENARGVAEQLIPVFEPYDYVVIPSGSCAEMIAQQYPRLFPEGSAWQQRALALGKRFFELTSFLVDVMHYSPPPCAQTGSRKSDTYLDGCFGLRKLGVKEQPRKLLKSLQNIDLVEMTCQRSSDFRSYRKGFTAGHSGAQLASTSSGLRLC